MPKIKILSYHPYEYELLQKELDILGLDGYKTDDISFITFFKKTNKKQYYKIDFYNPQETKRKDRKKEKEKFIDSYRQEKYTPVYKKNGMYVFIGEKKIKSRLDFSTKKDFVNKKRLFKYLYSALTSLIISIIFIIAAYQSITIDTFNTYGLTFVFIGLILFFASMTYRCMSNARFMSELKLKIHKKDNQLLFNTLKKRRKIFLGIVMTSTLCLIGGLVEDTFNSTSFSIQEHPILQLEDLNIDMKSNLQTQVRSSFTIPKSYTSLEETDDNTTLFIKEYNLSSKNAAVKLLNDLEKSPKQYYCTTVEKKDNVIYGKTEETLSIIIIQKEKKVTLISPSFNLTDKQINTILTFYNKGF